MEIKIKKKEFLNLLRWSQGIVERRGTMPILSNLLLEAVSDGLRVSATDLEISLVASCPAEIKTKGKLAVGAKNLYEIVKEAPEEIIQVSEKGQNQMEIVSGKSRFRLVGVNPDEFPNLPEISTKEELKLEPAELSEMIEKTFYSASTDEARYTLNGAFLTTLSEGQKNKLRMVTTDGHRLAYEQKEINSSLNLGKGIIVPRKGISEVRNLLSSGEGELSISVGERVIGFRRGPVNLIVRLIEGDFPSYEQVIPKQLDKMVSVEREQLVGALRRASIMTSEQTRSVKLSFSSGGVEISSSHPDLGEAREEIVADYKGPSFSVGFNPRYFLDILGVLDDEKVVLEFKDEVSPCVMQSEFDRGFLALIMPMRI